MVFPPAALLARQMSVATVIAAAMTQRTMLEPKIIPVTVLASRLKEAKRIHDSEISAANSPRDDTVAVTLVDDVLSERRNAVKILRINKIVVKDTAENPSTAEAVDCDILMVMYLTVLSSCVWNGEFYAAGLRQMSSWPGR